LTKKRDSPGPILSEKSNQIVRGTTLCCGQVVRRNHGRPCRSRVLTAKVAGRWREKGWITPGEHLLIIGTATNRPLGRCRFHVIAHLEMLRPGAAKRIYRDTLKGWKRRTGPAHEQLAKMLRAGVYRPGGHYVRTPDKQCTARSKRTGKRCRQHRADGTPVCRYHGSRGAPFGGMKRGDPRIAASKRRSAAK
jgi:hypothetical protein